MIPPGKSHKFLFTHPLWWGAHSPNHIRLMARSFTCFGQPAAVLAEGDALRQRLQWHDPEFNAVGIEEPQRPENHPVVPMNASSIGILTVARWAADQRSNEAGSSQ